MHSASCFCGSGINFEHCCGRFHRGAQRAATAEQLMRSRYSAFCCKNADYLIATQHASQHSSNDKAELQSNFASIHWLGLKIIKVEKGGANDNEGVVEFEAHMQQQNRMGVLREVSRFVKENDQWFYVNGVIKPDVVSEKLGRNDPCFCGSGKKFKKCHGA